MLAPLLRIEAVRRCRSRRGRRGPAILITSANGARALAASSPARRTAGAAGAGGRPQQRRRRARAPALPTWSRPTAMPTISRGSPPRALPARGCRCSISPARIASGELGRCRGLTVRTVVVYRAAKADAFPPEAQAALEQGRHRRRAAFLPAQRRRLSRLQPRHRPGRRSSPCIIACRRGPPSRCGWPAPPASQVAARPDEASLLALVTPRSCQSLDRIV